jgi:hemerythrin-like domain-containing protein
VLIYEVLKMDHRMVMSIIDTIEMIPDGSRRKAMLSLMRVELNMHANSEEEHFYNPLRARLNESSTAGQMLETAEDEHHQVEKMLMKLQMGGGESEDWLDYLRALRAMLQRHILKEESDVFHLAQEVFGTLEAADMAARFLEGKGRLAMENPIGMAAHAVRDMLTK